jgi:hypothetical protein
VRAWVLTLVLPGERVGRHAGATGLTIPCRGGVTTVAASPGLKEKPRRSGASACKALGGSRPSPFTLDRAEGKEKPAEPAMVLAFDCPGEMPACQPPCGGYRPAPQYQKAFSE